MAPKGVAAKRAAVYGGRSARRSARTAAPGGGLWPGGQEALALHLLADQLAGAAHRLGPLAGLLLGRLLVVPAELHLPEDALALHLLLQGAERLIDVVFPDKNLHAAFLVAELS